MNNITSILPRLQASNLSKIENGRVNSDNALREIHRRAGRMNSGPVDLKSPRLYWTKEDVRQNED